MNEILAAYQAQSDFSHVPITWHVERKKDSSRFRITIVGNRAHIHINPHHFKNGGDFLSALSDIMQLASDMYYRRSRAVPAISAKRNNASLRHKSYKKEILERIAQHERKIARLKAILERETFREEE